MIAIVKEFTYIRQGGRCGETSVMGAAESC